MLAHSFRTYIAALLALELGNLFFLWSSISSALKLLLLSSAQILIFSQALPTCVKAGRDSCRRHCRAAGAALKLRASIVVGI